MICKLFKTKIRIIYDQADQQNELHLKHSDDKNLLSLLKQAVSYPDGTNFIVEYTPKRNNRLMVFEYFLGENVFERTKQNLESKLAAGIPLDKHMTNQYNILLAISRDKKQLRIQALLKTGKKQAEIVTKEIYPEKKKDKKDNSFALATERFIAQTSVASVQISTALGIEPNQKMLENVSDYMWGPKPKVRCHNKDCELHGLYITLEYEHSTQENCVKCGEQIEFIPAPKRCPHCREDRIERKLTKEEGGWVPYCIKCGKRREDLPVKPCDPDCTCYICNEKQRKKAESTEKNEDLEHIEGDRYCGCYDCVEKQITKAEIAQQKAIRARGGEDW